MKKIIYLLIIFFFSVTTVFASTLKYKESSNSYKYVTHNHSESSYQHAWCSAHKGIEEYENNDFTRVDCLTTAHAVEFDFANKWAESIGQALHYQLMTGKRGMVVLILENPKKQMVYFNRLKTLGTKYNFDVQYVTPQILHLNKEGKCPYKNCKCNN